jgi:hypothetical protein
MCVETKNEFDRWIINIRIAKVYILRIIVKDKYSFLVWTTIKNQLSTYG